MSVYTEFVDGDVAMNARYEYRRTQVQDTVDYVTAIIILSVVFYI